MHILLLYTTHEGQTKKIMMNITQLLEQHYAKEINIEVVELKTNVNIDLSSYQLVVIGSSIRYGRYNQYIDYFIKNHYAQLNSTKSAFFGVNLLARKAEKNSVMTNSYTRKFLENSPWKPTASAVFAGALRYTHYNSIEKVLMKLVMWMSGGITDTSKEVEYTDWQQVELFTQTLIKMQLD